MRAAEGQHLPGANAAGKQGFHGNLYPTVEVRPLVAIDADQQAVNQLGERGPVPGHG